MDYFWKYTSVTLRPSRQPAEYWKSSKSGNSSFLLPCWGPFCKIKILALKMTFAAFRKYMILNIEKSVLKIKEIAQQ